MINIQTFPKIHPPYIHIGIAISIEKTTATTQGSIGTQPRFIVDLGFFVDLVQEHSYQVLSTPNIAKYGLDSILLKNSV